jgi:hypothetical protein
MLNSMRWSEDDARWDWTSQHQMKQSSDNCCTVLKPLLLYNLTLHPHHSSHNHHLHLLGLGVVTILLIQHQCGQVTVTTHPKNIMWLLRPLTLEIIIPEYFGSGFKNSEMMNAVKWNIKEWWERYNITLFYGTFSRTAQSEWYITENDT